MKNILGLLILICSSNVLVAQSDNVQLELGGNGFLFSFNYENQFKKNDRYTTFYRLGVGAVPVNGFSLTLPTEIGCLVGNGKNHVEFSTGVSLVYGWLEDSYDDSTDRFFGIAWMNKLGYRFQKPGGRFIFRASFIAIGAIYQYEPGDGTEGLQESTTEFLFQPWGAISLGYVLRSKN